jgi:hypothetical protein
MTGKHQKIIKEFIPLNYEEKLIKRYGNERVIIMYPL